jgi:hypothetical protein
MRTLSLCSIALFTCAALSASIDFAGLPGANGSFFSTYTEDGFTVKNIAGAWQEAQGFGDPAPDVGCDGCNPGTLQITNGGTFTFLSVDLGDDVVTVGSTVTFGYSLMGFLDGNQLFSLSGIFPYPFEFVTFQSGADSTDVIDTLDITLTAPGNGGLVDNINVVTIAAATPEPGTFALLAAGFGLFTLARKRRA